jgi:DNA gyrase/topoisomerase IV subunit B
MRLEAGLQRKGILLNEYLQLRRESSTGRGSPQASASLPRYLLIVNPGAEPSAGLPDDPARVRPNDPARRAASRHFAYTYAERDALLQSLEQEKGTPLVLPTRTTCSTKKETADIYQHDLRRKPSRGSSRIRHCIFREGVPSERPMADGRRTRSRRSDSSSTQRHQVPVHDLCEVLEKVKENVKGGLDVKRFKGLGEMNPEELFSTTMDPAKRTLLKVTLKEVYKADEYFTILMGTNVESRRKFIQHHAREVKNLDI